MEQAQQTAWDQAQDMIQRADRVYHLAEVIVATDPHDIDHRQLANVITDDAAALFRYAGQLSDEIERARRAAEIAAEAEA